MAQDQDELDADGNPGKMAKKTRRNKLGHVEDSEQGILNELDPPTGVNEDWAMRHAIRESEVHNAGFETSEVGGRTNKLGGKLTNTGAGFEQVGDSKQGTARDSLTSEVSGKTDKLGGELTNDGGTFEEFADSNAGKADDSLQDKMRENTLGGELKNKGGQWEKANKGRMSEGRVRDQDQIAEMMDGPEVGLQSLFDSYANQNGAICLEDFRALCETYELPDRVTEQLFMSLMDANQEFLFQEARDAGGTYWTAVPLLEELGTAGVGEQPIGMGDMMSRKMHASRASQGREAAKDDKQDDEVVPGLDESCPNCGNMTDALGCPSCHLIRESDDLGFSKKPDTNNKSGIISPASQEAPRKPGGRVQGVDTHESKSGKARDGFTKEVGGGRGDSLDPELSNEGGQFEEMKGGKKAVEESVARLALSVKRGIDRCLPKLQPGRYSVSYVVEGAGVVSNRRSLTEALVDAEELLQALGQDNVRFTANFNLGDKLMYSQRINLPAVRRRVPIVSENRVLFRFKEVANLFARGILAEGKACRMRSHNWGVAVEGRFGWNTATRAFATLGRKNLTEAWGTQVRPAEQEVLGIHGASPHGGQDSFDEPTDSFEGPADYEVGGEAVEPEVDQQGEGEGDEFIPGGGYNPEAPGHMDPEGQVCPTCGSGDYADDRGICPECGQQRPGGSPEADFGAQIDPRMQQSDEYLDMNQDADDQFSGEPGQPWDGGQAEAETERAMNTRNSNFSYPGDESYDIGPEDFPGPNQ